MNTQSSEPQSAPSITTYPNPQFQIDSELIQNYRMASAIDLEQPIHVVNGTDGQPIILSVGEDSHVYAYTPDLDQAQGWIRSDTGVEASMITAGAFDDVPFFLFYDNNLNLNSSTLTEGGTWSTQQLGPAPSGIGAIVQLRGQMLGSTYYLMSWAPVTQQPSDTDPPYVVQFLTLSSPTQIATPYVACAQLVDSFAVELGYAPDNSGSVGAYFGVTPQPYAKPPVGYQGVYGTNGNQASSLEMTIFEPICNPGCLRIGDLYSEGFDQPPSSAFQIITAASVEGFKLAKILTNPTTAALVYEDINTDGINPFSGSGDGQLQTIGLAGGDTTYVPLGSCGTNFDNSNIGWPDLQDYALVNSEFVVAASDFESNGTGGLGEAGNTNAAWWTDQASGNMWYGAVNLINPGAGGINSGSAFIAQGNTQAPSGSVYCLAANPTLTSEIFFMPFDNLTDLSSRVSILVGQVGRPFTAFEISNENGSSSIFYADTSGAIYQIDPSGGLEPVELLPPNSADNLQFSALAVASDAGGSQLYALSTDNALFHATSSAQDSWSAPLPLSLEVSIAQMATDLGLGGNVLAYCSAYPDHGTDHQLLQIYQDPQTTDIDLQRIGLEGTRNLLDELTWNVAISVVDSQTIPMPGQTLQITAPEPTMALVNNSIRLLSSEPATVTTLTGGQVIISLPTVNLGASTLELFAPGFMTSGESIVISPNAKLQNKFRSITGPDLAAATKTPPNGAATPLIPETYQPATDDLAAFLNQSAALIPENTGQDATYLQIDGGQPEAQFVQGVPEIQPGTLDLKALENRAFVMDWSSGLPRFSVISADEEAAVMANINRLPGFASLPQYQLSTQVADAWGSFWHGVKRGYYDLKTLVISGYDQAKKAIMVAAEFLVNGVKYAFLGAMELVQQVFDVVQGLFAQVEVFFQDLVEWIGYLFSWDDILRTQEALDHSLRVILEWVPQPIVAARQQVDSLLAGLQSHLDNAINGLKSSDLLATSYVQLNQQNPAPPSASGASQHNILANGFLTHANSATLGGEPPVVNPSVQSGITDAYGNLQTQGQSYQQSAAFQDANTYYDGLQTKDDVLKMALTGLLDVLQDVGDEVLTLAQDVADGVLDALVASIRAFIETLEREWDIPFVSDIYAKITASEEHPDGQPLTILGAVSLFLAVPATITYKVIKGAAPFPDNNSLQDFLNDLTVEKLTQGWSTTCDESFQIFADDSTMNKAQVLFAVAAAFSSLVGVMFQAPINLAPAVPGAGLALGPLNIAAVTCEVMEQVFTFPLGIFQITCAAELLNCVTYPQALSFWMWVAGWGVVGYDLFTVDTSGTLPQSSSPVSVVAKSLLHGLLAVYALVSWFLNGFDAVLAHLRDFIRHLAAWTCFLKLDEEDLELWLPVYAASEFFAGVVSAALKLIIDLEDLLTPEELENFRTLGVSELSGSRLVTIG